MTELSRMRISDADRLGVIDHLQRATAEGRLDLDELDDRIASALAARTWSDVDPLIDDLPVVEEPEPDGDAEGPPAAPPAVVGAGSLITLSVGALSIVGSFWSAWGAVLGICSAVLGVVLLLGPGELSRSSRFAALAGIVLGLMPSAFFVMLIVSLSG